MDLKKVYGIILPMSKEFAENIIKLNKTVFVKYTTHEPTKKTKKRLKEGDKFYIYVTGGTKEIIGEADIINCEYLIKQDVLKKYSKSLAISKEQLDKYSKGRENKKLLVLSLSNVKKYKKPIKLEKPITMTGLYIKEGNKEMLSKGEEKSNDN